MQTTTVVARDELIEFCKMFEDLEQEKKKPQEKPRNSILTQINLTESDNEEVLKSKKPKKRPRSSTSKGSGSASGSISKSVAVASSSDSGSAAASNEPLDGNNNY